MKNCDTCNRFKKENSCFYLNQQQLAMVYRQESCPMWTPIIKKTSTRFIQKMKEKMLKHC